MDGALGSYSAFAARAAGGRVDLHIDIDIAGRQSDRRADFAEVYGDWDDVRERAGASTSSMPTRLDSDVRAALDLAHANPAALAREDNADAALALMTATG